MKRISLSTAKHYLAYKDNRAVISWCKRHSVHYFLDGSINYIVEDQFFAAIERIQQPEVKKINEIEPPKIALDNYRPRTKLGREIEKRFNFL